MTIFKNFRQELTDKELKKIIKNKYKLKQHFKMIDLRLEFSLKSKIIDVVFKYLGDVPNSLYIYCLENTDIEDNVLTKNQLVVYNMMLKIIKGGLSLKQYDELVEFIQHKIEESNTYDVYSDSYSDRYPSQEFLKQIKPIYEAKRFDEELKNKQKENIRLNKI